MHLAQRALRHADPGSTTVPEVATGFGFWELGRFSVAYRCLFGETPPTTLRRSPDAPRTGETAQPVSFTQILHSPGKSPEYFPRKKTTRSVAAPAIPGS